MTNMHYWARKFSEAKGDGAIDSWFVKWVQTADQHYSYPTIAKDGREFVPSEPGLYLWGSDSLATAASISDPTRCPIWSAK